MFFAIWGDIMLEVYSLNTIRERVIPVAKQYNLDRVTLFGSYARGEATTESDIDLMISYHALAGAFALGGVYVDMKEALAKPVDIVCESALTADYASESDLKLLANIKKEGVLLYVSEQC